ncbi:MAG: ATP-dependent DNA helicase RecG [Acidobacteriota bacterium]
MAPRSDVQPEKARAEVPGELRAVPSLKAATARKLAALGVRGPEDLLWRLPYRYEDRRNPLPLSQARPGAAALFRVRVGAVRGRRAFRRRRMHLLEAIVSDATGSLHAVWFNQPWLEKVLLPGREVFLYGRVGLFSTRSGLRLQLESPEVEAAEGAGPLLEGRVVPVYRCEGGLTQRELRGLFAELLLGGKLALEEVLPEALLREESLPPRRRAFEEAHFPPEPPAGDLAWIPGEARRRLAFEELLAFQWELALSRREREESPGVRVRPTPEAGQLLRRILPFRLTGAQRRVLKEVVADLEAPRPMYRLLYGDVGSGKTIVAFLAMVLTAHAGYQAAFLAPTEILALQQFQRMEERLRGTGIAVGYLAASVTGKARNLLLGALSRGELPLVVGTHSLLGEAVSFRNLGLAVIDEQHRFGVLQRARIAAKGESPNVLVMSATPIPRSLALTLYGDLDLSLLDEKPPGRRKVATVLRGESARRRLEAFLRKEMDEGRQVFVVFPLVEGSEEAAAAEEAFRRLTAGPFRGYPAALLHGRLKAAEKERVMGAVRRGEVRLLVATTVVEVGVDLPEASVMVVENAERFGLAQLHQLRGRVGRGEQKAYCVLMASPNASPEALERLRVLERFDDGFAIAEEDLRLRGAGDPRGTRQWGGRTFRVANPLRDHGILQGAREWARRLADPRFPWGPGEKERFLRWIERQKEGSALDLSRIG